jgi:hypothetical protein
MLVCTRCSISYAIYVCTNGLTDVGHVGSGPRRPSIVLVTDEIDLSDLNTQWQTCVTRRIQAWVAMHR